MKKKKFENIFLVKPPKSFKRVIMISFDKEYLILDCFESKIHQWRYCMNKKTFEHAVYYSGLKHWCSAKLCNIYRNGRGDTPTIASESEENEKTACEFLTGTTAAWMSKDGSLVSLTDRLEYRKYIAKCETYERNHALKIKKIMDKVPPLPEGIPEWIEKLHGKNHHYIIKAAGKKNVYYCSACGEKIKYEKIKTLDGKEPKSGNEVICPSCKVNAIINKRVNHIAASDRCVVFQEINKEISVERYLYVQSYFSDFGYRTKTVREEIRIINYKNLKSKEDRKKKSCQIYYLQEAAGSPIFHDKRNPNTYRTWPNFIWPNGEVEEALKGTAYERYGRIFDYAAALTEQEAANGKYVKINTYRLQSVNFANITEMLLKNGFYKLLTQESENVGVYSDGPYYYGNLNIKGESIREVFRLNNKQEINRLKKSNGDYRMLNWLQYGEKNKVAISDAFLEWTQKKRISVSDLESICAFMTPEKTMNYIIRQNKESYPDRPVIGVIHQYGDYINMCKKLNKNLNDEMIFRPRELKRRHDEAVEELNAKNAEIEAEKYNARFPKVQEILKEIKSKYEYESGQFVIRVPKAPIEIVAEGRYLHHCAGACDRYFDRIQQHETYICFLRRKTAVNTPFYTIEVEPGGTIRQHRSMYDEEPDLDEVKPFLMEWQKVIRKRMSEEDHKRAAESKVKREANIEELKKKNNTRVLQGLMEDLMEAM